MRAMRLSLVVLCLTLLTALPARAQDPTAKENSRWADDYHLTLPKLVTVLVGALAGGTLLYVVGEQIFVETMVDTSVGVTQTVVASDIAEHSGIVTAMTIFGGTIGGILSGIGYDRYSGDVQQAVDDVATAVQDAITAGAGLF